MSFEPDPDKRCIHTGETSSGRRTTCGQTRSCTYCKRCTSHCLRKPDCNADYIACWHGVGDVVSPIPDTWNHLRSTRPYSRSDEALPSRPPRHPAYNVRSVRARLMNDGAVASEAATGMPEIDYGSGTIRADRHSSFGYVPRWYHSALMTASEEVEGHYLDRDHTLTYHDTSCTQGGVVTSLVQGEGASACGDEHRIVVRKHPGHIMAGGCTGCEPCGVQDGEEYSHALLERPVDSRSLPGCRVEMEPALLSLVPDPRCVPTGCDACYTTTTLRVAAVGWMPWSYRERVSDGNRPRRDCALWAEQSQSTVPEGGRLALKPRAHVPALPYIDIEEANAHAWAGSPTSQWSVTAEVLDYRWWTTADLAFASYPNVRMKRPNETAIRVDSRGYVIMSAGGKSRVVRATSDLFHAPWYNTEKSMWAQRSWESKSIISRFINLVERGLVQLAGIGRLKETDVLFDAPLPAPPGGTMRGGVRVRFNADARWTSQVARTGQGVGPAALVSHIYVSDEADVSSDRVVDTEPSYYHTCRDLPSWKDRYGDWSTVLLREGDGASRPRIVAYSADLTDQCRYGILLDHYIAAAAVMVSGGPVVVGVTPGTAFTRGPRLERSVYWSDPVATPVVGLDYLMPPSGVVERCHTLYMRAVQSRNTSVSELAHRTGADEAMVLRALCACTWDLPLREGTGCTIRLVNRRVYDSAYTLSPIDYALVARSILSCRPDGIRLVTVTGTHVNIAGDHISRSGLVGYSTRPAMVVEPLDCSRSGCVGRRQAEWAVALGYDPPDIAFVEPHRYTGTGTACSSPRVSAGRNAACLMSSLGVFRLPPCPYRKARLVGRVRIKNRRHQGGVRVRLYMTPHISTLDVTCFTRVFNLIRPSTVCVRASCHMGESTHVWGGWAVNRVWDPGGRAGGAPLL